MALPEERSKIMKCPECGERLTFVGSTNECDESIDFDFNCNNDHRFWIRVCPEELIEG